MINIVEPVRSILGPATPEPEVQRRAAELWECLELAVGTRLGSRLTDHEMIEFERLHEEADERALQAFLGRVAPDYPVVVQEELDRPLRDFAVFMAAQR